MKRNQVFMYLNMSLYCVLWRSQKSGLKCNNLSGRGGWNWAPTRSSYRWQFPLRKRWLLHPQIATIASVFKLISANLTTVLGLQRKFRASNRRDNPLSARMQACNGTQMVQSIWKLQVNTTAGCMRIKCMLGILSQPPWLVKILPFCITHNPNDVVRYEQTSMDEHDIYEGSLILQRSSGAGVTAHLASVLRIAQWKPFVTLPDWWCGNPGFVIYSTKQVCHCRLFWCDTLFRSPMSFSYCLSSWNHIPTQISSNNIFLLQSENCINHIALPTTWRQLKPCISTPTSLKRLISSRSVLKSETLWGG